MVICDGCGDIYDNGDYIPSYPDKISADDDVRNYGEWHKEGDKYYCTV